MSLFFHRQHHQQSRCSTTTTTTGTTTSTPYKSMMMVGNSLVDVNIGTKYSSKKEHVGMMNDTATTTHHDHHASSSSKSSSPSSPRIPLVLQNIFVHSNRGQDVHVPPPKNLASRIFSRYHHTKSTTTSTTTTTKQRNTGMFRFYNRKNHKKFGTVTMSDDHDDDHHHVANDPTTTNSSTMDGDYNDYDDDDDSSIIVEVGNASSKNMKVSLLQSPQLLQQQQLQQVIITPSSYIEAILKSRNYSTTKYPAKQTAYYNTPTIYQKICYNTYLLRLMKEVETDNNTNNLKKIQQLFQIGISSNPCNQYGESLLHTICRLGRSTTTTSNSNTTTSNTNKSLSYQIFQIMIQYGKTDISNCVDDYGRTILHDACWSSMPCYDIISYIIQHDPTMLLLQDSRGAIPFDYIPTQYYTTFIEYISDHKDIFFPIRPRNIVQDNSIIEPFPSRLVYEKPNTRPVVDPINALSHNVARLVVSGRITPKELSILLRNNHIMVSNHSSRNHHHHHQHHTKTPPHIKNNDQDDDDDDDDDNSEGHNNIIQKEKVVVPSKKNHNDEISEYNDDDDSDVDDDESDDDSEDSDDDDDDDEEECEVDEDDDDDDDDDDESYSDLEEMIQRLQGMKRCTAATTTTNVQGETVGVLGISRPQYGYEQMKYPPPTKNRIVDVVVSSTKEEVTDDYDNIKKPMSVIIIPTTTTTTSSNTKLSMNVEPKCTNSSSSRIHDKIHKANPSMNTSTSTTFSSSSSSSSCCHQVEEVLQSIPNNNNKNKNQFHVSLTNNNTDNGLLEFSV